MKISAKKEWEKEQVDELFGSKFAIIEICSTARRYSCLKGTIKHLVVGNNQNLV